MIKEIEKLIKSHLYIIQYDIDNGICNTEHSEIFRENIKVLIHLRESYLKFNSNKTYSVDEISNLFTKLVKDNLQK